MKIYVGNLPYDLTEDELTEAFTDFGDVQSARILVDQLTGSSKGFGFIEMKDDEGAEEAIKALDASALKGRNIKVNKAKSRGVRTFRRTRNNTDKERSLKKK